MKEAIKSQFHAALAMMKQVIESCPESLWLDHSHTNPFWHVAYHALFYTHLYLQPTEEDFTPWPRHRDDYQFMGSLPGAPEQRPQTDDPYSRSQLLAYQRFLAERLNDTIDLLDLSAGSGFYWLPFDKLELQLYNLRHLQLHIGELCERLDAGANISIDWVGMRSGPE